MLSYFPNLSTKSLLHCDRSHSTCYNYNNYNYYTRDNKCAKNVCKWTVLLQLIENVVTCFLEHSVDSVLFSSAYPSTDKNDVDVSWYVMLTSNARDLITAGTVSDSETHNQQPTTLCPKQELSYRKQIARELRTQYVEGIYDNPVTLKSRLTVTQGHWKRNHWVDHTWLTISRVIGRWILSWPWNVGQRSLKVIEISAIRQLGCSFLFVFYSNYGRICSRLWDTQYQRMAWPWKPG